MALQRGGEWFGCGVISGLGQRCQHRFGAGQGIQTHGMRHLVGPARIGGEDQRHPPIPRRGDGQSMPCAHLVGDGLDPFGMGRCSVRAHCRSGSTARRLEAGDACQQTSVDLGQDDMHGQIGGDRPRSAPAQAVSSAVESAT
jgi:hypothetical protein